MRTRHFSIIKCTLAELLVFAIVSVLRGITVLEGINKIWIALISVTLLLCMASYRYSAKQFSMLYLTAVLHIIALYFTDFPLYHFNMLFYFLLWVLICFYFAKSKKQILGILDRNQQMIRWVLTIWTCVVGISMLFPSSYRNNYFVSFAESSFRLMPAVLVIQALAMYMSIRNKEPKYDIYLLIPTFAAFMNESRTYFVVYFLFLLMYIYMRVGSPRRFYKLLIPLIILILLIMSQSGIADKLRQTQYTEKSYLDYWGTLTNGRSMFWKWDLDAFFALPFWQQFVGNGFNFVYEVTDLYGGALWAHNDVINLLMNFGYLGVIVYCWSYFLMVRTYIPPKTSAVPRMVKVLFHGAILFNSMMNMSYTYVCAVISYPLFLCVIHKCYLNRDNLGQKYIETDRTGEADG